jgi:hypothetical protein
MVEIKVNPVGMVAVVEVLIVHPFFHAGVNAT